MNLIHWLIKRSETYRHLADAREESVRLHAEKLHLQDMLTQERAEKDWLREQLLDVIKAKEEILKMQVNVCYQEKYGFRLYNDSGGLPEVIIEANKRQKAGPVHTPRPDQHEVAARLTAQTLTEYNLRVEANRKLEAQIREAAQAGNNRVVTPTN